MKNNFWNGKKVLITGHTGFKGSWLTICLLEMGAEVIGFSLDPHTEKDNFVLSKLEEKIIDIRGNICNNDEIQKVFDTYKPEIVFHMAAQPLVRKSYANPVETYQTNVMGTLNLLECIRNTKETKIGILITTDKCYENKEQLWGYREIDRLGGYDPYSSSKACAEILISSYRDSYFNIKDYDKHGKAIASVRAGNVIGGGDWSEDRLIPDCIRALEAGKPIEVRSPNAVRPWQHVLEALSGYLMLAENLYKNPIEFSGGWNFGPEYDSFTTVIGMVEKMIQIFGCGEIMDVSNPNDLHEAKLLFLDITKSKHKLNWKPKITMFETIQLTIDWYKNYEKKDVYDLCKEQVEKFIL